MYLYTCIIFILNWKTLTFVLFYTFKNVNTATNQMFGKTYTINNKFIHSNKYK